MVPVTVKLPFWPLIVPGEVVPSPQLIVALYALAVAPVFGSVIVATVPPTVLPAGPANEKPPVGTVSLITVFHENVSESPAPRPLNLHAITVALSTLLEQVVLQPPGSVLPRSCHIVEAGSSLKVAPLGLIGASCSRGWLLVAVGVSEQATPTTVAPSGGSLIPKPLSDPLSWQSAAWRA